MKSVVKQSQPIAKHPSIKFDTYLQYLACVCEYLTSIYTDIDGFISNAIKSTSKLRNIGGLDFRVLERFLRIAWNTEFLLYVDYGDPEITRINNQWTPIQAYYAVYSGLEALGYSIDRNLPNSHYGALKKGSEYLIKQRISPWDKAFDGAVGKSKSSHFPINFHQGMQIPHNLARSGFSPIEMVARCLRAEHSHRVDYDWKGKKHSGCYKYQYDPGPTTILHFLYRLRIKSNYKEVDTFVAKVPKPQVLQFAQSLRSLTSWTLALIEVILIRRIGLAPFASLSSSYQLFNTNATNLQKRIVEYSKSISK